MKNLSHENSSKKTLFLKNSSASQYFFSCNLQKHHHRIKTPIKKLNFWQKNTNQTPISISPSKNQTIFIHRLSPIPQNNRNLNRNTKKFGEEVLSTTFLFHTHTHTKTNTYIQTQEAHIRILLSFLFAYSVSTHTHLNSFLCPFPWKQTI